MNRTADVVVIGQGIYGNMIAYQLARRNIDVISIDQIPSGHYLGSSHGESRITRCAIGEGSHLSSFALRSHQIWPELEDDLFMRDKLYLRTGGLVIGSANETDSFHGKRDFFAETVRSAQMYDIPHRILSAEDIRSAFPQFQIESDEIGYYEHTAGILFADKCVLASKEAAQKFGGTFLRGQVQGVTQRGEAVTVATRDGEISAKHCILAVGPWISRFLPALYRPLFKVQRQVVYWFEPDETSCAEFSLGRFPVFIWGRHEIYGFPTLNGKSLKVAHGADGQVVDPDSRDQSVSPQEYRDIITRFSPKIPAIGKSVSAQTCLYTKTPDSGFVIDQHPEMSNVLVVSACSGHGFKHSAAIGELAAQLMTNEPHDHDLNHFSFARFKNIA